MADRTALSWMALAALLSQARYEHATRPALEVLAGVLDHFIEAVLGRMRRSAELYDPETIDMGAVALDAAGEVCGGTERLLEELVEYMRETSRGRTAEGAAVRDVFVERGLLPAEGLAVAPVPRNLAQKTIPDTVVVIDDEPAVPDTNETAAMPSEPDQNVDTAHDISVAAVLPDTANESEGEHRPKRKSLRRGSTDTEPEASARRRRSSGR